VSGSLPGLIDFYEEHGGDPRFEILAFHDNSVDSLEELEKNLKSVKEKRWEGRDLPFPVLFDGTDTTLDEWGIHSFPTMALIDPEGRFVKLTRGVGDLCERVGIDWDEDAKR
jgi:hypothetical protein